MTNNELRYVQIPMAEYEAMRKRIARKENLQFTADELRLLLEKSYPHPREDVSRYMELYKKIYTVLMEAERNE
ncbi:hypothetical protein IDC16_001465 [Salmonella enterica subsp. enterica serovar Agbeni]|uniref:hypothetical protein n=1 Tax=Salmonella enterica TaxID=28901 RepID=UPI00127132DF|nr:hypothetical protein [Salmonella enterica]ECF0256176.1 hypothetical protein [Salmonella enterica subsp. enterica serovar Agbeni]ECJ1028222.1 hypothetical protein [Salmonella enterica subsp. enterica serovar Nigeria]EGF4598311.1 hypothetical protein [Salmonella enterica subsp. enterica serovar Agama]ECK8240429.1 hypothetical protein [Salmonella enterica subsp. enterica serovar Agbeni]ECL0915447.1 hypothetical protein [Salmonella enterica subsp. enterica serovar Agbeni]